MVGSEEFDRRGESDPAKDDLFAPSRANAEDLERRLRDIESRDSEWSLRQYNRSTGQMLTSPLPTPAPFCPKDPLASWHSWGKPKHTSATATSVRASSKPTKHRGLPAPIQDDPYRRIKPRGAPTHAHPKHIGEPPFMHQNTNLSASRADSTSRQSGHSKGGRRLRNLETGASKEDNKCPFYGTPGTVINRGTSSSVHPPKGSANSLFTRGGITLANWQPQSDKSTNDDSQASFQRPVPLGDLHRQRLERRDPHTSSAGQ